MRLANLKAVLPDGILDDACIEIKDGLIIDICQDITRDGDIDGQGFLLLPGFIDLHGDMIEKDVEPRPQAYFPTDLALYELDKRLAALGITTAFATISFSETKKTAYLRSEERARETIELINRLRSTLKVDTYIHARFEITNQSAPAILEDLLDRQLIHLISLNDHTPGQGQYRNIEAYIKHVSAWKGVPEETFREETMRRLEQQKQNPVNWDSVQTICEQAKANNITIVSHDDDTPEKVSLLSSLGATISEFPVTLEAAKAAKAQDMYTIMGAPNAFRGGSNTGNLSALKALEHGLLDILAADYYPAAMLHSVFKLSDEGILQLHEAVKLISTTPAVAMNLEDRGSIELGKRADFVLVDNHRLPQVKATFSKGKLIFSDGTLAHCQIVPENSSQDIICDFSDLTQDVLLA